MAEPPSSVLDQRRRGRLSRLVGAMADRVGARRPHDRYLLEEVIFPAIRERDDLQTILFVGCDRVTRGYPALFADREFITIDVDPAKAQFGGATHVTDSVVRLLDHVEPGRLDVVICNGVIGWGLDSGADVDAAIERCFEALRPGGIMLLGWNEVDPHRPPALESVPALARFEPFTLPPFPGPVYPTFTPLRHVFGFYVRPSARRR